ncbi:MAG: hypothetical protein K6E29_08210 [Cyanobacteria bacterium RUI128]|nr:hypothetical protein [Cyanobacteria bacterium RUI128]
MLSAVNMSPSFGKSRPDAVRELQTQKSANSKSKLGAQACVLLGYAAGAKVINTFARGKSFGWNTYINNTAKKFVQNTGDFFGSDFLKKAATKISKTSGRQKLLGVAALLAAGAFVNVSEYFAKKQGKLESGAVS